MESYKITVVLPTEAEGRGSATRDDIAEELESLMIEECGGCTVIENARGSWKDDDGNVVSEPVERFETVGVFEDKFEARAVAADWADIVSFCTTEDAVLYTVQETHYEFA